METSPSFRMNLFKLLQEGGQKLTFPFPEIDNPGVQ
jgi:hypothetical protein